MPISMVPPPPKKARSKTLSIGDYMANNTGGSFNAPPKPVAAPKAPIGPASQTPPPGATPVSSMPLGAQALKTGPQPQLKVGVNFKPPQAQPVITPPAGPIAPPQSDWDKMYGDIMSSFKTSNDAERGEINTQFDAMGRSNGRMADLMNARMGRSIGGGYGQLQAQGQLGAESLRQKALGQQDLRSGDQMRQLQMVGLDKTLQDQKTTTDQDFQRERDETLHGYRMDESASMIPGNPPTGATQKHYEGEYSKAREGLDEAGQQALDAAWNEYMSGAPGGQQRFEETLKGLAPGSTSADSMVEGLNTSRAKNITAAQNDIAALKKKAMNDPTNAAKYLDQVQEKEEQIAAWTKRIKNKDAKSY
jgi:hypothetical protein